MAESESMSPAQVQTLLQAGAGAAGIPGDAPYVHEVLLPMLRAQGVVEQVLWGDALPPDIAAAMALSGETATRAAGYLLGGLDSLFGAPGRPRPRAVIVPSAAVLAAEEATAVERFVHDGGTLLVFGYGSALGPDGLLPCYRLHAAMGGHLTGPVAFHSGATRLTFDCDSIWGGQYPPENVVDGRADTFWASAEGAPMPHHVTIGLGAPRRIAGAKVLCRPGFLLRDLQIQADAAGQWRTMASVTDNEASEIGLPFEQPVETSAVRVLVTRETLGGENRVIADVGEVILLDESGRPVIAPPFRVSSRITDADWARENRQSSLTIASPAVRIKPGYREVIARFADPVAEGDLPLAVRNRFGRGVAYHFATPEGPLIVEPGVFEGILRASIGTPIVRHSGDESVRAYLTRGDGSFLLQLVDTAAALEPREPREVIVRVDCARLPGVTRAVSAEGKTEVPSQERGGRLQFVVALGPVATVVLR